MKRTLRFVFLISICLTMTLSLCADNEVVTYDMITGYYNTQTRSVTLTCWYCNNRVAEVYCVSSSNYATDVACSITSHQPCTIEERKIGYANAWCSYCQESYGWDWPNGHIDSCKHESNSGTIYYPNLCNYGPRK